MKNIMTKCLVLLLVLCMAVMIVACNNNEGDTTKKDDGTTTQNQGPGPIVPDGEPTTGGGNGGDVDPDPVDPLPEGDPNRDPGAADQF